MHHGGSLALRKALSKELELVPRLTGYDQGSPH